MALFRPKTFSKSLNCIKRLYSSQHQYSINYILDEKNLEKIKSNVDKRKGIGNIHEIHRLNSALMNVNIDENEIRNLKTQLHKELLRIPNNTHPAVLELIEPRFLKYINKKSQFQDHKPIEFEEIVKKLNIMRTDQLGHTAGPKSYYFMGDLAEMEEALVKYTVKYLIDNGFELISVPDIIPGRVLESCGMNLNTDRTQLYQLEAEYYGDDYYLSGTAEMALAGMLENMIFNEDELPVKYVATSRCYRAETSNVIEQRGIYRVHQFTKVEMFVVSRPSDSDDLLENIRSIQEDLFQSLDIHMQVLDMPPNELGAAAYRKYDIEAWMPGRNYYGEISSCSNCTDYQSSRLGIKYRTKNGTHCYTHTLNGTACAVPRMLITLLETHQKSNGKVSIPKPLRTYIGGKEFITRRKSIPELKLMKIKQSD